MTKTLSKETEAKILEAVRKVRQKGSSGKSILERAVNRGIDSITSSVDKIWLVQEILQGRSVLFLADVLRKLNYDTNSSAYKGSNGYIACSYDYIKNIEKQIFGNIAFSKLSGYYSTYAEKIKSALSNIGMTIKADLETGKRNNDYIKSVFAKYLREFILGLSKVQITIYKLRYNVDSLDWYVGGSVTAILKFQKAYNTIRFGPRILEDGVYGEKTDAAVSLFVGYVTTVVSPLLKDLSKSISNGKLKLTNISSKKYTTLIKECSSITNKLGSILSVLEAIKIMMQDINDTNTSVERQTVIKLNGIVADFIGAFGGAAIAGLFVVGAAPAASAVVVGGGALIGSIGLSNLVEDYLTDNDELVDKIIDKLNNLEVKLS